MCIEHKSQMNMVDYKVICGDIYWLDAEQNLKLTWNMHNRFILTPGGSYLKNLYVQRSDGFLKHWLFQNQFHTSKVSEMNFFVHVVDLRPIWDYCSLN